MALERERDFFSVGDKCADQMEWKSIVKNKEGFCIKMRKTTTEKKTEIIENIIYSSLSGIITTDTLLYFKKNVHLYAKNWTRCRQYLGRH